MSNPPIPNNRPRSGRDLFMIPQNDRLNDQFRFIDTMVLSMTDSWAYLPPRAKHILWLKLSASDPNLLEKSGMPIENGMLLHWSMWPDDLGDYAQAIALRMSYVQLENLEPKNVAMASALKQAQKAEDTARLQIQLAQHLIQLQQMGADTKELAKLFAKNANERESLETVLEAAENQMLQRMQSAERERESFRNPPPAPPSEYPFDEEEEGEIPVAPLRGIDFPADEGMPFDEEDLEGDFREYLGASIPADEEEDYEIYDEEIIEAELVDGQDIDSMIEDATNNVIMSEEEMQAFADAEYDEEGDQVEDDS
tara:strand:+ start:2083 stop:3015 length:933 start_codon:yes stop_codon:yes gene_type:complete